MEHWDSLEKKRFSNLSLVFEYEKEDSVRQKMLWNCCTKHLLKRNKFEEFIDGGKKFRKKAKPRYVWERSNKWKVVSWGGGEKGLPQIEHEIIVYGIHGKCNN